MMDVTIYPYKHAGMWVFDDKITGLVKEPFVGGTDIAIDRLTTFTIPNADEGFRLRFSDKEFPEHQMVLEWRRKENGGNWYYYPVLGMEGWLCGELYRYFDEAPERLYVEIGAKEE